MDVTPAAHSKDRETPEALVPRLKQIAVAIVDDVENDRSLMTRDVDRSPHLETVRAFSCAVDALKDIPSLGIEVVLLDVRMPGMSGIECTRQLKNLSPRLVIIMISGFDHPDISAQAREAGADAYLTKPFSLGQFLEAITVCLRRRNFGTNETPALRNFLLTQAKETSEPAPASSHVPSSDQCPDTAIEHRRSAADQKQGPWLFDEPTVLKALRQMVRRMEENFHSREDLLQQARVYLCSRERQYPGQRRSWYLQGVRFCLQHLRTSGRSIDSAKRRGAQASLADNCHGRVEWLDTLEFDEGIMSEVNARDIFSLLLDRLKPIDRDILSALAEGYGSGEVAKRLGISVDSIRRHRHEIAAVALRNGIVPPTTSPDRARRRL